MGKLSRTPLRCLLVGWSLLLVIGWRPATGQQQQQPLSPPDLFTSEVVIPGTGRALRLPHSLRPPLHETHASQFHRKQRRDEAETVRILPPPALASRRHRRQDDQVEKAPSPPPSSSPSTAPGTKIDDSSGGGAGGDMASSPTDKAANLITSNSTQIAEGGGERRAVFLILNLVLTGLADKQIVIIVVCVSIGLVICLLGAALLGKFYWGKRREEGAGYQGVRQKDPSEGNSPVDDHRITAGTHKEKDGRVLSNMFAQIDEIDEDSVPGSPVLITTTKVRRQSSQPSGVVLENGETKPLLNYSATATTAQGRIEDNDESSCNERANGKVISKAASVDDDTQKNTGGTREVQVEVLNAEAGTMATTATLLNRVAAIREPEPRLYCRTGLSQSDYSISSFTSVNPSYHYGNQVGYMGGYYGYPCESGLISPEYYDDNALLLPGESIDDGGLNGMMVLLPPPSGVAPVSTSSSNLDSCPSPINDSTTGPDNGPDNGFDQELPPPMDSDAPSPLPETLASREDGDELCSVGTTDDLDVGVGDGGVDDAGVNNVEDDYGAPPEFDDVTVEVDNQQSLPPPIEDEPATADVPVEIQQSITVGQAIEMLSPPLDDEPRVTPSDGGDVTTMSGGNDSVDVAAMAIV